MMINCIYTPSSELKKIVDQIKIKEYANLNNNC